MVSPICRALATLIILSTLACGGGGDDASGDAGQSTDALGGGDATVPRASCDPLPAPSGMVVDVGPTDDLAAALDNAPVGATISLANGTYAVPSAGLWIRADGVTVRSASGDATAVVLDASYGNTSGGVISVAGRSDVTIAHLTIRRARFHAIHVSGGMNGPSLRTRIYGVHAIDPGEQTIKINSNYGYDTDNGEIACSQLRLTDAGRAQVQMYQSSGSFCYTGGVDAHRARGWRIRDNSIEGFWCNNSDLSEHGIHFWNGGRDTVVERNMLIDNARGIGFGLGEPTSGRAYSDDPCPGTSNVGHFGGVIRNNMIVATRAQLFASPRGMDLGIGLESACNVLVTHNTVASTIAPFSSIEWRFDSTSVELINNLVTHNLRDRGGSATSAGDIEDAPASVFEDLSGHDLHLSEGAAPINAGGPCKTSEDIDGDPRDANPDVGADERL